MMTFYVFFFLSLLIRRPPTSPLFPYTTLFRSLVHRDGCAVGLVLEFARWQAAIVLGHGQGGIPVQFPCFKDRKSTRLNSSHVAISYAVCCLKKKKLKKNKVMENVM